MASNIDISVHYMVNSILKCLDLLISEVSEQVGPSGNPARTIGADLEKPIAYIERAAAL
jgi:hypothetical protein